MTLTAHYDGKVLVPDGPVDLKVGEQVELSIQRREEEQESSASALLAQLPVIHISAEDARAINQDPAFDAEEA